MIDLTCAQGVRMLCLRRLTFVIVVQRDVF